MPGSEFLETAFRLLEQLGTASNLTTDVQLGNAIGDSLDWFIGSWSRERATELEAAISDFEVVDEDM